MEINNLLSLPDDYLYLKFFSCEQSSKLCVIFGGAGYQDGKYQFYKTFNSLSVNRIYVSFEKYNTWYAEGIKGLGKSIEDSFSKLASLLLDLLKKIHITDIYVIGPSMGGYAALCFTHF